MSNRGGLVVAVVSVVLAGIATRLPYPAVVALSVAVALALSGWLHDLACGHYPGAHVVYRLVDKHGVTLYIGSTNDLRRRLDEHTNGGGEPWRRHIHAAIEHRLAVSERQARRMEERMIRAVTKGAEDYHCTPLHNDVWAAPVDRASTIVWVWIWKWLYLAQSMVFRGCAWAHPAGVVGWLVLAEHRPDDGSEWDGPNDDPEPPDEQPTQAYYQRSSYPPAPPYEMIALGPVASAMSASASASQGPLKGASATSTSGHADADAQATTDDSAQGPTHGNRGRRFEGGPQRQGPPDDADRAARRRAADAERKRRARAAAKAAQQP
jgi:predicted GIY-YIG superfamily endonuclease